MRHAHHSDIGAVAAGHPDTARAGAEILEAGGNAVDAVVAMMFAGCVAEGTLTSLGGGGFLLVDGPDLRPMMLDFFVRQPGYGRRAYVAPWDTYTMELGSTDLCFGTGPVSVAVPTMPMGLAHATALYGNLPLRVVAEPAAELATSGVRLTRAQATEHAACFGMLVRDPDGRAIYAVDGAPRQAGDLFRQPLLAAAIEEIAATQARSFYHGAIADHIVAWSDARGGRISREDLVNTTVRLVEPLTTRIDGVTVHTNPPPAMGGRIITRLVSELLAHGRSTIDDEAVARTIVRVLEELRPPLTHAPVAGAVAVTSAMDPEAREAASRLTPHVGGPFSRSPNTTHVAAIDSDGMVATATTTVGFGAGEFVPGTGIQLNNILAEYDHTAVRPPGAVVPSMMSPTLLRSARSLVAIGSAGSDRIPQAISQILRRMWSGMPLVDAIDAPRFVYDGAGVHTEPGFDGRTLDALADDFALTQWTDIDGYFGTSNAVAVRGGELQAHGDRRREGAGIVLGG